MRLASTRSSLALLAGLSTAGPSFASGTWPTTLVGLDLDPDRPGFEAYYDTVMDTTWLTDVGAVRSSPLAWVDPATGQPAPLAWFNHSNEWLRSLSVGGVKGWRLPAPSEVLWMYETVLGNSGAITERGPFLNLGTYSTDSWLGNYLWTSEVSGGVITTFGVDGYGLNIALNNNPMMAWAVHDGRVTPVDTVGGKVRWADPEVAVTCANLTTGQIVSFVTKKKYDCEAQGLRVRAGDRVTVKTTGVVKPR